MKNEKNSLDIVEDIIVAAADNHTTAVQAKLVEVQQKMLKEGMYNGSHGIVVDKEVIQSRANIEAESCYDELKVLVKKKLGELQKEEELKCLVYEKSENSFKAILRDLEYLNLVKNNSNTSRSIISTIGCMLLGLFLILADIALALQLVMEGFIFPEPKEGYEINNLMTGYFVEVLKANWQVFMTTVGVATFTIILKIAFDRFIGTSYGDGYVKKMRFIRWFRKEKYSKDTEEISTDIEADLRSIRRYERIKNGTLIGLAALTIVFLYFLAQFRDFSMNTEQSKKDLSNEIYTTFDKGEDGLLPGAQSDSTERMRDKVAATYQVSRSNRKLIFFGTTLLFPIVSAICLSIASASLQNGRKIRQLKREAEETKVTLDEDQKLYGDIYGETEAWKLEADYLDLNDALSNFKTKLVDIYNYGFSIGRIRPDLFQTIPNLLTTIERYRDKSILFRTNEKLKRINNGN